MLCGRDPDCYLSYDWNNNLKYAFIYHFFGLLWTNQGELRPLQAQQALPWVAHNRLLGSGASCPYTEGSCHPPHPLHPATCGASADRQRLLVPVPALQ